MSNGTTGSTRELADENRVEPKRRMSRARRRWISAISTVAVTFVAGGVVVIGTLNANAAPGPGSPPTPAAARQMWNDLRIADMVHPEEDFAGYDRTKSFPHWRIVGPPGGAPSGPNCAADKWVKIRDRATGTVAGCEVTNGSWISVYDGVTGTDPSRFDADHIVPLHEAWKSGAIDWTVDERAVFANDVDTNLVVVGRTVNAAKGDRDPAQWMPPDAAIHCTYLLWWVEIKTKYPLTIDQAEWDFVNNGLNPAPLGAC